MISDSSHQFETWASSQGRTPEQIQRALRDARAVERDGRPALLSLGHLAQRTGASYRFLRRVVERDLDPYRTFRIHRPSGEGRPIAIPEPTLMAVQRWLLKHVLYTKQTSSASYAYARGKSIRQCADQHLGARWLVKLDIHDFFSSIDERRVYSVFDQMNYPSLVALELSRLTTRSAQFATHVDRSKFLVASSTKYSIEAYRTSHRGFLPQGSPTSGALANLVMGQIDGELLKIADESGMAYTRYADDMAFSTRKDVCRRDAIDLVRQVADLCRSEGFVLHEKKTRISPPGARKIVLGLLVDGDRVRLPKWRRRAIEAHIRGCSKFGLPSHARVRGFSSILGLVNYIDGQLAFAADIEPGWAAAQRSAWSSAVGLSGLATSSGGHSE